MRISTRIAGCVTAVLLIGAASISAQGKPAGAGAVPAELEKLAADFAQAWAKGDAKALAALHSTEAIRLPGDGTVVSGRAAIEKNFAAGLAGPYKGSKLTITPGEVRQLATNVYVGEGRYQVSAGSAAAGASASGQYLNTYVSQGGRWVLASSAVYPPAAPPAK